MLRNVFTYLQKSFSWIHTIVSLKRYDLHSEFGILLSLLSRDVLVTLAADVIKVGMVIIRSSLQKLIQAPSCKLYFKTFTYPGYKTHTHEKNQWRLFQAFRSNDWESIHSFDGWFTVRYFKHPKQRTNIFDRFFYEIKRYIIRCTMYDSFLKRESKSNFE